MVHQRLRTTADDELQVLPRFSLRGRFFFLILVMGDQDPFGKVGDSGTVPERFRNGSSTVPAPNNRAQDPSLWSAMIAVHHGPKDITHGSARGLRTHRSSVT